MNIDQLWKLLDSVQAQIRTFDTKAQIALGIDSLLAGLLGAELAKGFELAKWHFDYILTGLLVIAILSLVSLLASALFAIFTVVPRLHLDQPKSHFFFCHLVQLYGRKFHAADKSLIALTNDQMLPQLASQVQTNAIICDVKASRSRHALWLMTAALVLYVITFLPFSALAYRDGTTPKIVAAPCAQPDAPKPAR
ncbi:MAG TPA: Pycsar system effector family protein [Terracidiphilus sp.]|jgi:hypothetical protein